MITFGGFILTDAGGFWLQKPPPSPSPMEEGTVRFRFYGEMLEPERLTLLGTWTQVIDITSGQPIPGLWDYRPDLRQSEFKQSMPIGALTVESCNGSVDIVDIKLSEVPYTQSAFFQHAFDSDTAINNVNIENLTARVSCIHMFEQSGVTEANVIMDNVSSTETMFDYCDRLKKVYIRTTNGIGNNCFFGSGGLEDLTIEIIDDGYFIFQEAIDEIGGGANLRNVTFIAAEGTSYRLYRMATDSIGAFDGAQLLESVNVYERGASGQLTQVPLPLTGYANYAFRNCRSLTYMPLLDVSGVSQCPGMFYGCVNIAGGILDVYDVLKVNCVSYSSHVQAFTDCGIDTTTGRAELVQIPNDWK